MILLRLFLASVLVTRIAAAQAPAAAFVPGARTVAAFDFSTGALPAGVTFLPGKGTPEFGARDGQPMLKATGPTAFKLTLPEILPPHFTIEADFGSSSGSAQAQLSVAAVPTLVGTTRSALVVWHPHYILVARGGAAAGDQYFYPSAALLPELPNQLVHIQLVWEGAHFRIFTNDELIGDYPNLPFRRGQDLWVYLGGEPRPNGEVYLARLRIGSNSGATGVAVAANPSIPAVTPPASPGALATTPPLAAPNPARPVPPPATPAPNLPGTVTPVTPPPPPAPGRVVPPPAPPPPPAAPPSITPPASPGALGTEPAPRVPNPALPGPPSAAPAPNLPETVTPVPPAPAPAPGRVVPPPPPPAPPTPAPATPVITPSVTPPASAGAMGAGPRPSGGAAPNVPVSQPSASTGTPVPTVISVITITQGPAGPVVSWLGTAALAV